MSKKYYRYISILVGVFALFLCDLTIFSQSASAIQQDTKSSAIANAARANSKFIANSGQTDPAVLFYASTFSGTTFITKAGELVYSLPKIDQGEASFTGIALRESLVGGNAAEISGVGKSAAKQSIFKGNDPLKWKSNLATYQSVNFGEVYSGIDFQLKAYGNNVEKLFTVHPPGKVADIKLRIEGAKSLRVNNEGELEVSTELGTVRYSRPVAFQEINGRKVDVEVAYILATTETDTTPVGAIYGFKVGDYDRTASLTIDPLLASTFLGGNNADFGIEMSLDGSGNIIVAGVTASPNFPTSIGAFDKSFNGGSLDLFVAKINSTGDTLLFSTIIGGSNDELYNTEDMELYRFGLALDSTGNILVSANTRSTDFPITTGAYQSVLRGSSDAFVTKLSSGGDSLIYSTYLGGSGAELGGGIAVDSEGNIYVAGETTSADFPTTSAAYDRGYNGGGDIFVSKINPDGTTLLYSTYLGGNSWDEATDLAVDSSGNTYILGGGGSSNYPTTTGAFDRSYNGPGYDIYLTKLNAAGSGLVYSTFLGTSGDDWAENLAVDSSGNAYVGGNVEVSGFPVTAGAFDTKFDGDDGGFVAKINAAGSGLVYSTYISKAGVMGLNVDNSGNLYVTGGTRSANFPTTPDAVSKTLRGSMDVIVAKLNPAGSALLYSTYLGGAATAGDFNEVGLGIDFDSAGNIYVAGITVSVDFPTKKPLQSTYGGGEFDTFVAKISIEVATAVNGVCGNSNGQSFTGAPAINLCAAGSATAVSGIGPWSWSCTGSNGGSTADCTANIKTFAIVFQSGGNGTLSGATQQTVNYNANTTAVTAVPANGYHFVNWTSGASEVGTSATLTVSNVTAAQTITANFAPDPVNGVCGSADGTTAAIAPTTDLCTTTDTPPTLTGTGPWSWSCTGSNGGTTATCSAQKLPAVPGDCDANGIISISEVQSAVYMFLGSETVARCIDTSGDNAVSIAEIQKVFNGFLGM